ncbi:MAG: hypothetical protein WDZ94_01060 [Patescibacteria group bacterium]
MRAQEIIAAFIAVFVAIIVFLASIIFSFNPYTEPTASPTPPLEQEAAAESCSELSGQALQSCCQSWADSNQLMRVQCIGEWQLSTENQCAWQCLIEPN